MAPLKLIINEQGSDRNSKKEKGQREAEMPQYVFSRRRPSPYDLVQALIKISRGWPGFTGDVTFHFLFFNNK